MKFNSFFSKIDFQGVRLVENAQECPKQAFLGIFLHFAHTNKSAKQQTFQLEVFYQDWKLTTSFETFLALQGVKFSKNTQNWSKIAYLMEYIYYKCGSQKDVDKAVDSLT